MMTKDEAYDMFLSKAGKCPKCGEYLTLTLEKRLEYYDVAECCLSCDYKNNISNKFNEAIGLKQREEQEDVKVVMDELSNAAKNYYTASSKYPKYHYWNIDDVTNHGLECPFCESVDSYDGVFDIEYNAVKYICTECGGEFILYDVDSRTGVGSVRIVKKPIGEC